MEICWLYTKSRDTSYRRHHHRRPHIWSSASCLFQSSWSRIYRMKHKWILLQKFNENMEFNDICWQIDLNGWVCVTHFLSFHFNTYTGEIGVESNRTRPQCWTNLIREGKSYFQTSSIKKWNTIPTMITPWRDDSCTSMAMIARIWKIAKWVSSQ